MLSVLYGEHRCFLLEARGDREMKNILGTEKVKQKKGMNIWNAVKRKDGYFSIELTMIFPVIFFSLLLILFMGIVLYQEVNLQSLAVRASERGAVTYSSRVSDLTTNIKTLEDFKERDPYRNVPFIDGRKKAEYITLVNKYVDTHMSGQGIMLSDEKKNAGSYTEIQDYLIAKRIKVTIQSDYHSPVDAIAEMFGQKGVFQVNTTAVSAVVDAPDFVRNTDLVLDVAKQTKIFGTVQNGYNKIRTAMEKVTEFLKKE